VRRFLRPGQGGSVDANIQRWVAQFETPDGKPLATPAPKKSKVNGLAVTRLDLQGTYLASAGPMAPSAVKKPGYKLKLSLSRLPRSASHEHWFNLLCTRIMAGPCRTARHC
jgi:hypothetical protein